MSSSSLPVYLLLALKQMSFLSHKPLISFNKNSQKQQCALCVSNLVDSVFDFVLTVIKVREGPGTQQITSASCHAEQYVYEIYKMRVLSWIGFLGLL